MPAATKTRKKSAPAPTWNAEKLYARSEGNRRVMLLELVAWAIYNAETCATLAGFQLFEEELREVRESAWRLRPWRSAANDPDAFLAHVADMAAAFAGPNRDDCPSYPNRAHSPAA